MFYKGVLKILIFILCANCIQISSAQEIRVIDNKGTLKTAINNHVTTSATAPTAPLIADIWFDNTDLDKIRTKIYDGTNWKLVNTKVELLLDLTNTQKLALLLPTETNTTEIAVPNEGMLIYSSNNNNAYLRADNTWKPIAFNSVENELIFEGAGANINFYYVSMLIDNDWKVIKYDKTDVNVEDEASISNNAGQTTQPLTLIACESLTYN